MTEKEIRSLKEYFIDEYNRRSIFDGKFNVFITLASNRDDIKIETLKERITYFYNNICYRLFTQSGRAKNVIEYDNFFFYWGFYETGVSNKKHYHLIAYIDPKYLEYFKAIFDDKWKKVMPSGTTDIQDITDIKGLVDYCTKDLIYYVNSKHYIISKNRIFKPHYTDIN